MKSATPRSTTALIVPASATLQLGCMAATSSAVREAVDHGADSVTIPYCLIEQNKLHFCDSRFDKAVRYTHDRGRKLFLDLTAPRDSLTWGETCRAIASACSVGIDAIVLSDAALALHCVITHPDLPLHIIAPDTLTARDALNVKLKIGASRIIVPRTISIERLEHIAAAGIEVEVEELCHATRSRGDDACNDFHYSLDEYAIYTLARLPQLLQAGVRTIQIEATSSAASDVAKVTRVWRTAIDKCLKDVTRYEVDPSWTRQLAAHSPSRRLLFRHSR